MMSESKSQYREHHHLLTVVERALSGLEVGEILTSKWQYTFPAVAQKVALHSAELIEAVDALHALVHAPANAYDAQDRAAHGAANDGRGA
jgi:hypothetical protein